MMSKASRAQRYLLPALVLAGFLFIAWNVPYTHDDWDWGLPIGLERWLTGALNNRHVGTFFIVVMSRSRVLKALIMGGCMCAIPWLAARLAVPEKRETRLPLAALACAALTAMPMVTWRQTYGWVSAFANFVVPCVWVLGGALLLRREWTDEYRAWRVAILFFLALGAQLFVENLTAALLLAALCFALYARKTKRGVPAALAVLAGAAIGFVLMFHNPLYTDLLHDGAALDGVRQLSLSSGMGVRETVAALFIRAVLLLCGLFEYHPALWALVCAGVLLRRWRDPRLRPFVAAGGVFATAYLAFCAYSAQRMADEFLWKFPIPALRAGGAVCMALLLAAGLVAERDRQLWTTTLLLLLGVFALLAPFLPVTEFGPRCCFPCYALTLVLALTLLSDLDWTGQAQFAAALLLALVLLFHINAYRIIGSCSALRERLQTEAAASGAASVVLPTESRRYYYFWGRNPQSDWRADDYRAFYGLPSDLKLVFLPPGSFDLWPDVPPSMLDAATRY